MTAESMKISKDEILGKGRFDAPNINFNEKAYFV